MHIFVIILTFTVSIIHVYVFWRAGSVPVIRNLIPVKALILGAIIIWAISFLGIIYGRHGKGILAMALDFFAMNWMAVLFLVFTCLLAVDTITCFGFLFKRSAPCLRGAAITAGAVLSVIALIQGLRAPVISNYDIDISELPGKMDGTVIVALSDLHLASPFQKHWVIKRIDQVQSLKPDLIVLLGDIFEGHGRPHKDLLAAINRLSAPMGVWAVLGNHESYGGLDKNKVPVNEADFAWLRNKWVKIRPGLILAGVDDLGVNRRSGKSGDLVKKALLNRPAGATILLSHTPVDIEKAANAGADLMLCGHTHGGQIWPFGYLVKRVYPYFEGLYKVKDMTVIVSRGTGTWGPKMRLWHPGEILHITLHRKT